MGFPTIRASIMLGFTLMCLFTGTVGYYSYQSIKQSAKLVLDIYDRSLMSIDYARAAQADFAAMQTSTLRERLMEDPERRKELSRQSDDLANSVFEDLEISAQRSKSARARDASEAVKEAAQGWIKSARGISFALPVPQVMAELDGYSDTVDHQIDLLINLTAGDGFLYRQQALRSIQTESELALGLTGAALLLSALVTWMLTQRISGPIAAASAVAVRIADGDLAVAIPQGRQDELGSLLRSMGVMRDSIAAMMAAEVSQRRSAQARLMDAIHSTQEGVVLVDGVGRIVVTNDPIDTFFGPLEERIPPSFSISDLLRSLARTKLNDASRFAVGAQTWPLDDDAPGTMEVGLVDGRWLRVSWCKTGEGGLVAFFSDVTEARQREAQLAQTNIWFDAALTNMSQGLCVYDSGSNLKVFNSRFADIYRLQRGQVQAGMSFAAVCAVLAEFSREEGRPDAQALQATIAQRTMFEQLHFLADGRVIATSHRPVSDGGWVLTYEDVTERHRSEARISFLARHDVLTNLPNRMLFGERLDRALQRLKHEESFALLLIDLDRFKEVNDTRGHPVGDRLLRVVADRLLGCSRRHDTVARLGGDEFAIIQTGIIDAEDGKELARRVVASIGRPFAIDGAWLEVGASVGIVTAPTHGSDAETLLRNADTALYRAKEEGRNDFRLFAPSMDATLQDRRALEADLLRSLADNQMELLYQPIVAVGSGEVAGFEALVRWHHPVRGLLMPGEFIWLSEDTGYIERLGGWILQQACSDAAQWPEHIKLAINVSPIQFRSGRLVQRLAGCISETGINPSRIDLEITETALLAENDATLAMLRDIHGFGVKIVLDDFGTGFSSLSYLRSFPFDRIKIDRSFVKDLGMREDSSAIIRAIVALGKSLGMPVTAEGVETGNQLQQLRSEGCDEAQGFLFSRAIAAARVAALLANWKGPGSVMEDAEPPDA